MPTGSQHTCKQARLRVLIKLRLLIKLSLPRFGVLKSFMVNEGVGAIEIEERYETFVKELRTDRYVTATSLNYLK